MHVCERRSASNVCWRLKYCRAQDRAVVGCGDPSCDRLNCTGEGTGMRMTEAVQDRSVVVILERVIIPSVVVVLLRPYVKAVRCVKKAAVGIPELEVLRVCGSSG